MAQVKNIEKRVYEIEGFEIVMRGQDGKDLRGDYSLPIQYQAGKMTKNTATVSEWRDKFKKQFPGFEVDVLKSDETKAPGQMKLSTVRDGYLDEE